MTPFVWQVDVEWDNGEKKRVKVDKNNVIRTADDAVAHCKRVLDFTNNETGERHKVTSAVKVSDDPTPISDVDVTHSITKKAADQAQAK
jgi:hypothetical protein